jgi:hypothetical protein
MARIRTVKPEFFTSEDITDMPPLARLLYVAMWCEADRDGRMVWKPRTFKMRYLPADDCNIEELCAELVNRGLVKLYGDGLAYIPSFSDHQHINPRESASTLPIPDASPRVRTRRDASPRDSDAQVGKEGKGKERKEIDASDDTTLFDGVSPKIVADFKKLRSSKKAPITETAVAGIKREAEKAGMTLAAALAMCCERGWAGFKAEWISGGGFTPATPTPKRRKQLGEGSSTNYGDPA